MNWNNDDVSISLREADTEDCLSMEDNDADSGNELVMKTTKRISFPQLSISSSHLILENKKQVFDSRNDFLDQVLEGMNFVQILARQNPKMAEMIHSFVEDVESISFRVSSLKGFLNFLEKTKFPFTNMDSGYFCVLPSEIKLHIMTFLPVKDLVNLSRTCRDWWKVSSDEALWQILCERDTLTLDIGVCTHSSSTNHNHTSTSTSTLTDSATLAPEPSHPDAIIAPPYPIVNNNITNNPFLNVIQNTATTTTGSDSSSTSSTTSTAQPQRPRVLITKPSHKTWKWLYKCLFVSFPTNSMRNGPGKVVYQPEGHVYLGDWEENRRHGYGVYIWSDMRRYDGEWRYDKRNEWGRYTYPNGTSYEGQWKDDKRNGIGTYSWPEGRQYTGQWANHRKNGRGVHVWPDGSRYTGLWRDGSRNGRGRFSWDNGRHYDGEWENGRMKGHGTFTWADGDRYVGEWLDGKRWGLGKLIRADGSVYAQEWREQRFDKHNKGEDIGVLDEVATRINRKRSLASVEAELVSMDIAQLNNNNNNNNNNNSKNSDNNNNNNNNNHQHHDNTNDEHHQSDDDNEEYHSSSKRQKTSASQD